MNNETKKEAKLQTSRKAIQTRRKQNSRQEFAQGNNAWWIPLINYQDAWQSPKTNQQTHYYNEIDPREFLGTALRFTWE